MTPNLKKYRELEIKLSHMRLKRRPSDEEDPILDEMDELWWKLSTKEIDILEAEDHE